MSLWLASDEACPGVAFVLGLETLAFAQVWLAGCLAESCLAPALQYFVMNGLASVTVIIGVRLERSLVADDSIWRFVEAVCCTGACVDWSAICWGRSRGSGVSGACAHGVDAGRPRLRCEALIGKLA